MNIPKLRFKEFNDEWIKIDLSTCFEYFSTNSLSREQLSDHGIIKNIHYGDVHKKYGNVVDVENDVAIYIKDAEQINKYEFCCENDIIFADASEDYDGIGKAIELINVNEKLVSGLHTIHARDKKQFFSPLFKGYYFNTPIIHNQIRILANGFKVFGISKDNINNLKVMLPSKQEQEKIAKLLSLLDKKIQLQTKKIEALKLFKLSIKKKIFQTNINTEIKLNQLVKCESSSLTLSDIQNIDGPFPVYGAEGFIKNINFYNHNNEYIAIVKDGAGVGRTMICPSKSSTISTMNALIPILEYKATYILELLNLINFKKYIIGSGIPHIYFKDYGKEKIKIHSIDKSNKITKLFDLLNKRINYTQNHVEHLKKLKQGLLQIMFI